MSAFRFASAVAALAICMPAMAATVKPSSLSASSSFPPEDGVTYDAKNAADDKLATAWVEGEPGSAGAFITLDLGGSKQITGLKVWGGLWASYKFWESGNRPKEIEVKFSDESTETFELADEMKVQEVKFKKPVSTSSVRVRIKSVYSGSAWTDTGFSEIHVVDASPDSFAPIASFNASSTLPDDDDGNYGTDNLTDGMADSMWCEGSDGDGTGEWIEFNFKGSKSVSKLSMINGIGSSVKVFFKGNKATKGTLTFADGSTEQITIKPSIMPQTISFAPRTTNKVKLTFTEVKKGTEFNDLCVSEAYFE